MKETLYSANFKKDYLAYFSIGLFFAVVAVELYMAIWLPVYLKSQDKWAVQENRQEMIDLFDGVRRAYSKLKPSTAEGKDEVALILECLNNNAIYLREYHSQLNLDQIIELKRDYEQMNRFLKVHRRKNKKSDKQESSLGKKRQLVTGALLDNLRKKSETRLNKQIQQYNKNGYIE